MSNPGTEEGAASSVDRETEGMTFEDVNWTDIDDTGSEISGLQVAIYAVVGLFLATSGYDVYSRFVAEQGPIEFPVVGVVQPVEWLYIPTLLFLAIYGLVPMYRNPRMTRYYWNEFKRNRAAVVSLGWLVLVFLVGGVGSRILAVPEVDPLKQYQPPVYASISSSTPIQCVGETVDGMCYGTWQYPFGTTGEGKDIFISVIHGMEISMQVGLIGMFLIVILGSGVALTAAYFGGWIDEILFRYVDIQITFPTFFLYLLVFFLFDPSLFSMILIFGLFGWGGVARIVRSEGMQRREEQYVMAAENTGASGRWIIVKHLLPNVSNSVITAATLTIPSLILFEAGLAFLGLGDPTIDSWGELIASGRSDLDRAWWISTIPGIFLFLTILAFNFIGDAMRDALDPRSMGDSE